MQQLIYFLQKYKYFLFFLLLEVIAFTLIINNHNFHKSKFVSSTNSISGGLLKKSSSISDYFNLKNQNDLLAEENLKLKNTLQKKNELLNIAIENSLIDTIRFVRKYKYSKAKIESNNYNSTYNLLLINKGTKDGITSEMAVVNQKGIIGITEDISDSYARVQSILNKNSKINAKLKNSNHFGTLEWNGKDYNTVQLTDIPRQAIYKMGDTIITGGKSTIFPEGILIGTITKSPETETASNTLDIQLFNDMSNLRYAYIIKNLHKEEIKRLENSIIE